MMNRLMNAMLGAALLGGGGVVGLSPGEVQAAERRPEGKSGRVNTPGAEAPTSSILEMVGPQWKDSTRGPWRPDPAMRTWARGLTRVEAEGMVAGAAAKAITPTSFEPYTDVNDDSTYQPDTDTFEDTGRDGLFDWQEPGALGPDGAPGEEGLDDDLDGLIDEADEYGSIRSDDLPDPNGDNYNRTGNPEGTEGNGKFDAVVMAGYGGLLGVDIRPAVGVHDDIWSRAVYVAEGETQSIIIVNDVVGMLFHFMNPVKRALEADLGVPFDNIVIASTHTHQGPDTVGIWGGPVDVDYLNSVMDQMYAAGAEAFATSQRAKARSTTVYPRACFDKVTLEMKPDSQCDFSDYHPDNFDAASPFDQHITQNDIRDPWVRRLAIPVQQLVGMDDSPIATLTAFDTHPEVLLDENQLLSSDYPHFTREVLEAELGGVSLFFAGSVGCQIGALRKSPIPLYTEDYEPVFQDGVTDAAGNPIPAWADGIEDRTRSEGAEVGTMAARGLAQVPFDESPTVEVLTSYVDVTISNPIFRLIIQYISRQPYFEEQEYVIDAPYCTQMGCIRTPLQAITIGDATYLAVPGEFPPEYIVGRDASVAPYADASGGEWEDWAFDAMPAIEGALPGKDVFLMGLANNYFGYAMAEGDHVGFFNMDHPNYYEEVYATDKCFGDMVANRLYEMVGSTTRVNRSCPAYP